MDLERELKESKECQNVHENTLLSIKQSLKETMEKISKLVYEKDQLEEERSHQQKQHEQMFAKRESAVKKDEDTILDIKLSICNINMHIDILKEKITKLSKKKKKLKQKLAQAMKEADELKHSEQQLSKDLASAKIFLEIECSLFDMHIWLMQQPRESCRQEIKVSYKMNIHFNAHSVI